MSHCNGSGMRPTGNGGPCDGCQYCKPAPSPQPEMLVVGLHESSMVAKRGQLSVYPLTAIRELLATQGLAIVPAAEVTTQPPIERWGFRDWMGACESGTVFERQPQGDWVRFDAHCRLMTERYIAHTAQLAWREEKPRG
jgi:hypothetical protein